MNHEFRRLLEASMRLSAEARGELAGRLLQSLDGPDAAIDHEVEAAWELEIARREAELDTGRAKAMSWAEARRRILGAP